MKNLAVLNRGYLNPQAFTHPDVTLSPYSTFDAVTDSITYVFTDPEENSHVEVQQFLKNGTVNVLASFPLEAYAVDGSLNELVSFAHFVDVYQLVLVFSNGDIVTATYDASYDSDSTVVSIIGSIDAGVLAAGWSPDEETLTLLTKDHKLTLLSRLFEPISEIVISSADLLNFHNTNKHVSVGWGKKETQFQGKGARALEREKEALKHAGADEEIANAMRDPTLGKVERGCVSPYDLARHKVSWRGDGEFFAISIIEEILNKISEAVEVDSRRVTRVYTRDGELVSISEPVNNLEGYLAWKPQGALLASVQRDYDTELEDLELKVVFFEKNGLRHGEFCLRVDPRTTVQNVEWSCDSEILAVQLDGRVQLWTTKNYHWYLKQELRADEPILAFRFHPEKPTQLLLHTISSIQIVDLTAQVTIGPTYKGFDIGTNLVIDGAEIKFTPLALANVPPPIAFRDLEVVHPVTGEMVNATAAASSQSNMKIAAAGVDGGLYVFGPATDLVSWGELIKKGGAPKMVQHMDNAQLFAGLGEMPIRQLAFIGDTHVVLLVDGTESRLAIVDLTAEEVIVLDQVNGSGPNKIVLLKASSDGAMAVYETIDGHVYSLDSHGSIVEVCQFPQLCRDFQAGPLASGMVAFGLTVNGKLFANDACISSSVTSIMVSDSFLMVTTAQHQLRFVHLDASVFQPIDESTPAEGTRDEDERVRMIERGSILVNTMPSKSRVVLEAPRGNLETIHPRIMILSEVRQHIKDTEYYKAFMLCRTHRIDLDILHDYDPKLWADNMPKFVAELGKVEYLDLFVSCLHEEDVCKTKYKETLGSDEMVQQFTQLQVTEKPESKINKICEQMVTLLTQPAYYSKYLQTVITMFACQSPPNLAGALALIGAFTDADELEKSVTHLCFLQDVNTLYTVALGLYDVKLALNIAQQSQKDPKEYLPFLQNLHVQTPLRMRVMIDTHLKNFAQGLRHLHEMEQESSNKGLQESSNESLQENSNKGLVLEINQYIVEYDLYQLALDLYRYDAPRSDHILALYAVHLKAQQFFDEAGMTFEVLENHLQALECYILAKKWKEALTIAQIDKASLTEVADRLVIALTEDQQYSAAADIELKFLHNLENALKLYCKNYHFDEAILLCVTHDKPGLLESVIDPQLGEGFGVIAELLADCKQQTESQLRRLRELRLKKQENPYEFYGNPEQNDLDTPDNVSVAASETSTTPSFFTRYTGKTAGTAKTGASRKSTKNRKREERKRAKGRKGTIYEEEYLIKSVGRLLERLHATIPEAVRLIEGLVRRLMKQQAHQIQHNFVEIMAFLKENIVEIHNISERDRERVNDEGEVYLIPEIPVPEIQEFPRKQTLDF
ncbi:hypothetical protein BABINDRAFT_162043 [Babjeviella inositovora NRRL Y-12698]|uniref:Elongator complex protein 1 n=1 Tax=Babjeviella inositovora NRRL Y-12698 TaxID=984486 RepID=A0A1E3QPR2_9ASCO|nr:uncharacterized protein BABINDRAFT_162043 [Babjeviella inositovora NRRL Y-12698]ODQ78957.1 hypothetical protein BABINDRAFT_162043 [Babjeviella inositovora NRRL Y-12698]